MNKMTANLSIAAGVALALCKKEEGGSKSSFFGITDPQRRPFHSYTYDIFTTEPSMYHPQGFKALRIIRMDKGQNISSDSSWAKNPVFETPKEAYDAGMKLGNYAYTYAKQYNNWGYHGPRVGMKVRIP